MFSGRVASVQASRFRCEIEVRDDRELLAAMMPRNLAQPSCVNTLYDSACGAQRATYQVSGTATGGTVSSCTSALGQSASYFDQGTIAFTSGQNSGYKRTVKLFSGGGFSWALPLPYAVANGDAFIALPGCDKSPTTCNTKFANKAHNRSCPYIPAAEVAL
jgi:uncharacterized phage protein (TIGR02218 family)